MSKSLVEISKSSPGGGPIGGGGPAPPFIENVYTGRVRSKKSRVGPRARKPRPDKFARVPGGGKGAAAAGLGAAGLAAAGIGGSKFLARRGAKQAAIAEAAEAAKSRRKKMIGAGVGAGLAGTGGAAYAASNR